MIAGKNFDAVSKLLDSPLTATPTLSVNASDPSLEDWVRETLKQ